LRAADHGDLVHGLGAGVLPHGGELLGDFEIGDRAGGGDGVGLFQRRGGLGILEEHGLRRGE